VRNLDYFVYGTSSDATTSATSASTASSSPTTIFRSET
jgi:hypothetical protein